MNEGEQKRFVQILRDLLSALGKPPMQSGGIKAWWEVCKDMTIEQFASACGQFLATSTDWPTPAAIRDLAGVNAHGWPTPEEAWNTLPKSEYESGWMCQETITAYTACSDSIERGDMIGARMCFLEVYKREIKGKRGEPKWWISWGIGETQEQREVLFQKLCLEKPRAAAMLSLAQCPSGPLDASVPMLPTSRSNEGGFKRLLDLTGSTNRERKPSSN